MILFKALYLFFKIQFQENNLVCQFEDLTNPESYFTFACLGKVFFMSVVRVMNHINFKYMNEE